MKKVLSFAVLACAMSLFVACGDDDETPAGGAETFSKAEVYVALTNIPADILNNYTITLKGVGFAGDSINETITADFDKTYTCTTAPTASQSRFITLKLDFTPKAGHVTDQQLSMGGMTENIHMTIFDKSGAKLRDVSCNYVTDSATYENFDRLDRKIQLNWAFDKTMELAYVKNALTGKYMYNFGW